MTNDTVKHCQSRLGKTWTKADQELISSVLHRMEEMVEKLCDQITGNRAARNGVTQ